jgi:predicted nucleic acid-binding protein
VIVIDASALLELLLGTALGRGVASRVADPRVGLHTPHLADLEVAQALRRYVYDRQLEPDAAGAALRELRALDLERHPHEPLLDRVWALRDNVTAYDAAYVALAEALAAPLLTCDARLARAPGTRARIELMAE